MAKVRGKLAGDHPQLLSLFVELNAAAHSALFTCLGDFLATPSVSLVQILCVWTDNWKTTAAGQETQNSTCTGKINTERTRAHKAEQHLSPQTKANTFYSLNLLVFQKFSEVFGARGNVLVSRSLSTAVKEMCIQPLFGGDARSCLPKKEHQALPRNFLEDVIKRLILAGLSKLFVPVFYCLLKRKWYCKYFPPENTNKQLIITARELTTFPPSGFWHWQLTQNSCWWLGQMDFIY